MCRCRRRTSRASGCWRIMAKRAVLATGADRAAAGLRRQRPAGRDAGRRGAHLCQPLGRGAGRAAAVFTNNDARLTARRATSQAAGVDVAAHRRSRGRQTRCRRRRRRAVMPRDAVVRHATGRQGALRHRPCALAERRRAASLPTALAMSGGWNPAIAPRLPSRRASRSGIRAHRGLRAAPLRPGSASRARPPARCARPTCLADGARAAERARRSAAALERVPPSAHGHRPARRRSGAVAEPKGKAFVDFQNDVTLKESALAAREGYSSVEH